MTTSVKVDDNTKDLLEALQAEIKLATGKKVTQQEILARLVRQTYRSKEEFLDSFREEFVPLNREQLEKFNSGMISSGKPTQEEDIDEIIYG